MINVASSIIRTERDIRLIRLDRRKVLVVSCDSSGAVGSKVLDQVKCSPYMAGRFAARVALMEALAVGATPICVATPLAVEPTPTGKRIMRGIRSEMESARLDSRTPVVDSTEKNFKIKQTGVGVTVVGLAKSASLKVGRCAAGDEVFALGSPCVGSEVLWGQRRHTTADTQDVCTVVRSEFIHETIPVGSKGIAYEAQVMARDSNLHFEPSDDVRIDLSKSAGPATVIVFACRTGRDVLTKFRKPVTRIGFYVN